MTNTDTRDALAALHSLVMLGCSVLGRDIRADDLPDYERLVAAGLAEAPVPGHQYRPTAWGLAVWEAQRAASLAIVAAALA